MPIPIFTIDRMPSAAVLYRSPRLTKVLDAGLVAVALGIGLAGHIAASNDTSVEAAPIGFAIAMAAALAALALWLRRTRPLQSLGLLLVVTLFAGAIREPALYSLQVGFEAVVVFHAAGSWYSRQRLAVVVAVGAMSLIITSAAADDASPLAALAFAVALVAFPFAAGYAARVRRNYLEQIEQRLIDAERQRETRESAAIAQERSRIAREMHDVVAHHVSLIGVQAGAARTQRDTSPEATQAALLAIEASSRAAVGEMQRLLAILEPISDGVDAGRAPQPGLHDVAALVERMRTAGIEVSVELDIDDRELAAFSAALSLTCYRLVEESLTNVLKHSQAERVMVQLSVANEALCVRVLDPGPAKVSGGGSSGGRGLYGMQQRVEAFGGTLEIGPTSGGGFRVEAVIPKAPM